MVPWSLDSSVTSVVDLWHFGAEPFQDPNLQIHTADLWIWIRILGLSHGSPGLACSPCQKVCWSKGLLISNSSLITTLICNQCSGSSTFWSGSRSADPYRWLTVPDLALDPALFISNLHKKKKFSGGFRLLLFEGTFTSLFKDKKSQNSKKHGFSYYYFLMMEGSVQIMINPDKDPDPDKQHCL